MIEIFTLDFVWVCVCGCVCVCVWCAKCSNVQNQNTPENRHHDTSVLILNIWTLQTPYTTFYNLNVNRWGVLECGQSKKQTLGYLFWRTNLCFKGINLILTIGLVPKRTQSIIGESRANWHPGRIGTPRVSAHVAVANLWRWCFYVANIPTRIPRTYGDQTRLGLKIIMTNHFWTTWVYFFNNTYFVFSS